MLNILAQRSQTIQGYTQSSALRKNLMIVHSGPVSQPMEEEMGLRLRDNLPYRTIQLYCIGL